MSYTFTKMHGLGNDFVIFDAVQQDIQLSAKLIQRVSDRRFGIGCDQVLLMKPANSDQADVTLEIFNADGSPAGACGNGTRCIAWLQASHINKPHIRIATVDRVVNVDVPSMDAVSADMGKASCQEIDLKREDIAHAFAVDLGNPHVVLFAKKGAQVNLEEIAKDLQHNLLFPQGTNVELVEVLNRKRIRMDVWERGVGITAACGTGACAAAAASYAQGLTDRQCQVQMAGGYLTVDVSDALHIKMTGAVCLSYTGTLDLSLFE